MKKDWLVKSLVAGVPVVLLETYDAAQSMKAAILSLGEKNVNFSFLEYDRARGLVGHELSLSGQAMARAMAPNGIADSEDYFEALRLIMRNAPEKTIIFYHGAQDILGQGPHCQAIWVLRDILKERKSMLVLMTPGAKVPESLKYDLLVITEPLPAEEDIARIVQDNCDKTQFTLTPETKQLAVARCRGILTEFAIEQAVALSLDKDDGLDLQALSQQRRAFVQQTDGLEIRTDSTTFADIAGYRAIKRRILQEINSKAPPDEIVWLDELREMVAGANSLDGTTRDQLGHWQGWLQDRLNADTFVGIILVGFPGTCKSALAASTRNEAQCECLRVDFGAQKSKFVGESEQKARIVTRTIDAIGKRILCIATCNGLEGIPAPFLSRFTGGTYFFDLATEEERDAILALKRAKFNISDTDLEPDMTGWTGRDIHECCRNANRLGISLIEAARGLTPFCKTNRADIDSLRKEAVAKGWLSASTGEAYVLPSIATGRKIG